VAAFCALVLWGLGWGVPSSEKARLEGASAERMRKLPPEAVHESWQIWGSRGRRSGVAELFPRHLFNPVRSYHPDEYQVFKSLSNMRPGSLDFDPGNYIYPSLHTYLVGAAEGACGLLGIVRLKSDLGYYFEHPDEMGRMYLVGRVLSLLAAAGALLLVWRVGESMGRGTGLIALVLLAAMPAFGVHAHNLTRDTCAALAAVALFACCRKVAETGEGKWFDLAGAAAGLCVAFQYFAVVLWGLIPLAAVLWLRREVGSKRAAAAGVGVSLVVMAAMFGLTNPYHLLHIDRFLADFRSETVHVGGGLAARVLSLGWATHLPSMLPALVAWPMALWLGVGAVVAVVRRRADDWLLLGWLVLWAAVVGLDGRAYSRYYVPLLPALALLGSQAIIALKDAASGRARWVGRAAMALVLAGVVGPAAATTWAWSRLYSRENVRTVAGEWIAANVPAGARVGMNKWPWQFEMPPIDPGRYRLVVLEDSAEHSPYDLPRLLQSRPDYFVTSSLQYGNMLRRPAEDEAGRFWQALFHGGGPYRVAKRFRIPLRVFGHEVDLLEYPEDMRYVNPVIDVLERSVSEARAGSARSGG